MWTSDSMDPTFPLAPIANFVAVILIVLPLFCTSIRSGSWSTAVTSFSIWFAISSATTGVNAIVWSDNVRNDAPVWCDISTYLSYANRIALRACTFIMTRSLYKISKNGLNGFTSTRSRRSVLFELLWIYGLPVLTMVLYYVVQEHRFEIIEEQGCAPAPAISGFSILFLEIPNLILPVVSALFYCPNIFWSSYKWRKQTCEAVQRGGISSSIYYRVMALGCVEAVCTLPLSIYMFIADILPLPTSFYPGWGVVHAQFAVIPTTPASEWSRDFASVIHVRWVLWTNPAIAVAFFALLGLTQEARVAYRRILWKMTGPGLSVIKGLKKALLSPGPVCSAVRSGPNGGRDGTVDGALTITASDVERSLGHVESSQGNTGVLTTIEEGVMSEGSSKF